MLFNGHCENRLLSTLPKAESDLLSGHLKRVVLPAQSIICEVGDTPTKAYFPHSGAIALVVGLSSGQTIETALIGRDGMVGGFAALASHPASCRAIVRLEGTASVIDIGLLQQMANAHEHVRSMLFRHESVLLAQTQQAAACNASHGLEARLCRWILRACDASGKAMLAATQEDIAKALGVRRTSITTVARTMQEAGLMKFRRGRIEVLDVGAMRGSACECYASVAGHYDQLSIAPAGIEVPQPAVTDQANGHNREIRP